MKALNLKRRKGQGMTEYIILVGILALLMIAAVNKFAFSVDEAIQGSANAFILHHPAEDYPTNHEVELGKVNVGGVEKTVIAKVVERDGKKSWKKMVGSEEYDRDVHGPITSGRF